MKKRFGYRALQRTGNSKSDCLNSGITLIEEKTKKNRLTRNQKLTSQYVAEGFLTEKHFVPTEQITERSKKVAYVNVIFLPDLTEKEKSIVEQEINKALKAIQAKLNANK